MGPKRGAALWPAGDETGWINGFDCRLTNGNGGLMLNVTNATKRSQQMRLPRAAAERAGRIAEKLGVRIEELPTSLLEAATAVAGNEERSRGGSS